MDIDAAGEPRLATTSRDGYWTRRLRRNAIIAIGSAALTLVVYSLSHDKRSAAFRWSMATGYAGTALIGLALVMGPWWLTRGRRVPVSTDVRRDVGLWGATFALLHVVTGLQVHMGGDMLNYFIYRPRDGAHPLPIRFDGFGVTNWTGLGATLVLIGLMAISNDWSLRGLGTARWKRWQRWTYVAAVLVALHGLAFQRMDRRTPAFVAVLVLMIGATLAFQLYGRRLTRAGSARQ
jgi:sulfoxide reductase heme-binding subunit YedZ